MKYHFRGGWVQGGGGGVEPRVFLAGNPFFKDFCYHNLSFPVVDCRRCRRGLIQEGAFAKGESNMGVIVPGALVPEVFGGRCAVPCDISKHSKYVETITHVENLSLCHL